MQIYSVSLLCFLLLFIVTSLQATDYLHSESGLVEGPVTKIGHTLTVAEPSLIVSRHKRSSCDSFKRKSQCLRLQHCEWSNRKRKCFRCLDCHVPAGANGLPQK
ncbi:unnamed protein product [Allacma fusca]|uniref:Uncharacterized protein n=1 Tax=Allacma fusca TaxID=39272 RepID=A0A8J2KLX4_9HEXA|nr:unnamed protein product [Allacma fusca]